MIEGMTCGYCRETHQLRNVPVTALIDSRYRRFSVCPSCFEFLAEHTARGEPAPPPESVLRKRRKPDGA